MTGSKLLADIYDRHLHVRTILIDLKHFSAISNIVLRISLQCTHIYHHDKDDDSIAENIIDEDDFLGKLKGEVGMLDPYFNYFNRIFFYLGF